MPSGPAGVHGRGSARALPRVGPRQALAQHNMEDNMPAYLQAMELQSIYDNAGGNIGHERAAKSPPDGHTLLAHTVTFTVGPHMTASPPADPLRDVMAVTQIIDAPNILVVTPSMPVRSVKELVALAAKRRGELSFASSGYGSGTHLSGELFKLLAKIDMIHIAYKGGGPAVADLLGGHVPTMFSTLPSVTSHVAASRLRALAVTGARRFPSVPEVPTMIEAGVAGYSFSGWSGIFAPIGTPREIAVRFAEETARVLRAPGFRDKLLIQGADAVGSTPDEFAAFVRSEYARWGQLVRQSGIKAEQ
jgi:tripartite-type tricarboxylate transporter receptor subunit TctC